jgi:DNA-binding NtrC family response regulator
LDRLLAYPWPGNVRELENCIEHAVVMSPGKTLSASLLPAEIRTGTPVGMVATRGPSPDALESELRALVNRAYKTPEEAAGALVDLHGVVERIVVSRAISEGMSQRTLAAKLGISRTTLRKRLQEYGLDT